MSEDKRKRSPNWLPSEKELLVSLVEAHYKIIENKKTDGVTVKRKLAQWQVIADQYNGRTTHCPRSGENLRAQWESLKKQARKDAANNRKHMIQTGGGPPDTKREDPVYSKIISLIKTSAVGLYNPYDSDSVVPVSETFIAVGSESENLPGSCTVDLDKIITDQPLPVTVEDSTMSGPTSVEIEIKDWGEYTPASTTINVHEDMNNTQVYETEVHEFVKKDWGDYNPKMLRTPVSAQLKTLSKHKTGTSRRRPLHTPATTSTELLHKEKIDAISLQKVLAVEEAERSKTVSELEIEIKKEILKQEKIKTKLLLLELRKKKKECKETANKN